MALYQATIDDKPYIMALYTAAIEVKMYLE